LPESLTDQPDSRKEFIPAPFAGSLLLDLPENLRNDAGAVYFIRLVVVFG
jgi:hypothetical protein